MARLRKQKEATTEADATADAPVRELDAVLAKVGKHKGENVAVRASTFPPANHIPTGSFILDFGLLGGVPEGYNTMIYGGPSSGKTTLAKRIVAEHQRKHPDKAVVWVDTEQMFDSVWATRLGVDVDKLWLVRPDNGNDAVDIIEGVMNAWETGMVVLDSVPSCVPKEIVNQSASDDTMAQLARLMGKLCSKVAMSWSAERKRGHHVTFITLNQWRSKVGLVFGDPRSLPGGIQINHLPTTKLELKGKEIEGTDSKGLTVTERNDVTFKIDKAKHGQSIRGGEFSVILNPDSETGVPMGGYDELPTVVAYAKKLSLITGGGSTWRLEGVDTKFPRLAEIQTYLKDNPDEAVRVKQQMIAIQRAASGLSPIPHDGYLLDWAQVDA